MRLGSHFVSLGIYRYGNMISAKSFGGLNGKVRGSSGFGADNDPIHPHVQVVFNGLFIANTAAHFQRDGEDFTHFSDDFLIDAVPFESTVQIHHMKGFGPFFLPFQRHFHRIIAVNGKVFFFSLLQTHAVPIFYIYRWKYFHFINHFAKRSQMAIPTEPDFSGWNWNPNTLSFPTTAGTVTP